jgi:hypothetical protein
MTVSDGIVIFYGVVILITVFGLRDVSKRVKSILIEFHPYTEKRKVRNEGSRVDRDSL